MIGVPLAVLWSLSAAFRTRRHLVLENLALRHQVAVLSRNSRKPKLRNVDRLVWICLRAVWSRWQHAHAGPHALKQPHAWRTRSDPLVEISVKAELRTQLVVISPKPRGKYLSIRSKYRAVVRMLERIEINAGSK